MVNELESYFSGKNVCVLGGAGFIGSALVHGLVEYKAKVTVVDGLMPSTGGEYANLERYKQKITFYPQRLEKCTELRDLLPKSDLIIDSMGYTRHNQAFDDPFFDVETNLLSHLYLVNALKGLRGANIIYLGGRGQYGNRITDDFIVETSCQSPSDVQGVTKSAAESLFRIYAGRYGFNAVSLRMTNCFGEGQLVAGEDIGFLGVLIRDLLRGETYQVFGSLNRIVNLLYIWDAVDAILRTAMNQPRGFDAFNVAGQAIDLKNLLDLMISRIGSGSYQLIATPDRYRGFISKADIVFRENKLIDLIGNYQRTSLEQALDRTVAYFESRE